MEPLGFVKESEIEKLRNDASKHTNVVVQSGTGRIALGRHFHMLTVPASVFIPSPLTCEHVVLMPGSLPDGRLRVLSTSVGCAMTRTLLWMWGEAQGLPERAQVMNFIGWRCVGSEKLPNFTPTTYRKVTCTRGTSLVEAKNEPTQMWE